ncbi:hypothetical protein GQ607_003178 [Colletotrichum asianum]|uniref:Uncharacterized protein n=1 Tax=Colletotrichum asianum TaxID=702518 RepID=A0A8H3WNW2_9PEZI|nr:hypothetical protein GQ607_003178 [Colletotrichum asianum]
MSSETFSMTAPRESGSQLHNADTTGPETPIFGGRDGSHRRRPACADLTPATRPVLRHMSWLYNSRELRYC